jgi:DNA-directed RNA polymerase specialized sigma24 family protein
MSLNDTSLGGEGRAYPSTQWSRIVGTPDLGAIFRSYWKPVYASIRIGWKKSNEDAKDQTQAFFTHLMENGSLARLQPEGGRFRAYLKQALRNFMIDADRAVAVRRPVQAAFSIDADPDALERWGPTAAGESPEHIFDREWLACLLDSSVSKLERELESRGKSIYFQVFRTYLLDPAPSTATTIQTAAGQVAVPTYADVAVRFRIKETDVRNYLNHCRPRLREILQEEIRATVDSDRDVEEELQSLLRG